MQYILWTADDKYRLATRYGKYFMVIEKEYDFLDFYQLCSNCLSDAIEGFIKGIKK